MKYLYMILLLSFVVGVYAQSEAKPKRDSRIITWDGMKLKTYYFVMLTTGEKRNEITDTNTINQLQSGHMANIKKLHKDGKILVAGPFGDEGNWRGIFIFDCDTQEEVETLLSTDPMVKAKMLAYEIHPWITQMNAVFK